MSGPIKAQPISFLPRYAVSASSPLHFLETVNPLRWHRRSANSIFVRHKFSAEMWRKISSYFLRKYADYSYTKWERTLLWDKIDPYRRPKSFTPIVSIYIAAFYTGVIGAAITEQLYKEKYWEDHPGEEVPLMLPTFYQGPWRVVRGEALRRPSESNP